MQNAVREEQNARYEKDWREYLAGIGTEVGYRNKTDYQQVGYYYCKSELKDNFKENIGAMKRPLFYTFDAYRNLYLLNEKGAVEAAREPEPESDRDRERRARISRISDLEDSMRELRIKFVKEYPGRAGLLSNLLRALILNEIDLSLADWDNVTGLLNIKHDNEITEAAQFMELHEMGWYMPKHPDKVLLAILADRFDVRNYYMTLHDVHGNFRTNDDLNAWYTVLSEVGYQISDEERKMLDGSHECFDGIYGDR